MDKVLVICGPTATGKTSLALSLARKFGGELISADSRQVYTHMDIGTGKDIPHNFEKVTSDIVFEGQNIPCYTNYATRIWGYDLVSPNEKFSVAHYQDIARLIINDVISRGKLPIIVGGSGLYIKAVIDDIETSDIPPNKKLRDELSQKDTGELFDLLSRLDHKKADSMNNSDKHNPRRLVRAIEIAKTGKALHKKDEDEKFETLFVGLKSNEKIDRLIDDRIASRLSNGFEKEIETLKEKNFLDKIPASTLGYNEWSQYLWGKISEEDAIKNWKQAERNYAKRQMTWFKKEKRIKWFDVLDKEFGKNVEKLVKKWYKQ